MPRLSLYRPEKTSDYKFIDRTIWEMFQVGGTDVFVHKYLGPDSSGSPGTPSQPIYNGADDPFRIQDLLFLENRDRKYAEDIFILRGVYNVQDTDFNLSQFGLFLQNDTIFITFHINDTVEKIGRKLISGDVLELPHLKDDHALNDLTYALKRFYVIEEVTRAAEGFSNLWYPHLYRAKCKPLVDSQEFKQILDGVANTESFKGTWEYGITYYLGDTVKAADGVTYVVINPEGRDYSPATSYYPGELVKTSDGTTYLVVDPSIAPWSFSAEYYPGQTFTGPDGKIYQVKDTETTRQGITGELPPDSTYYTVIQGNPVTGETPADSDRFQIFDINDGITNIFPPNMTYWAVADTLKDVMSTYDREMQITQAVLEQAEEDAPRSGYDTTKFYTIQRDADGLVEIAVASADDTIIPSTDPDGNTLLDEDGNPIYMAVSASSQFQSADHNDYAGYMLGDGVPANGAKFSSGIAFPINPIKGQFALRTDYLPSRLFRYDGARWIKIEDNVRMTMSNYTSTENTLNKGPWSRDVSYDARDLVVYRGSKFVAKRSNTGKQPFNNPLDWSEVRETQKTGFINNDTVACINGKQIKEKQSLSKALRPEADE